MKILFAPALAGLVALASAAVAQTPQPAAPICAQLVAEIELQQQNLAEGLVGRSPAGRDQLSYLQVETSVALMAANHCAPYAHVVTARRYLSAALACGQAGDAKAPACDRSKWKPED